MKLVFEEDRGNKGVLKRSMTFDDYFANGMSEEKLIEIGTSLRNALRSIGYKADLMVTEEKVYP